MAFISSDLFQGGAPFVYLKRMARMENAGYDMHCDVSREMSN